MFVAILACGGLLPFRTEANDPKPGKPFILASPNPIPSGDGAGVTTIEWSTGDGAEGEIYVAIPGQNEILFAGSSRRGTQEAEWIHQGVTYEFRLYRATVHNIPLATVKVRRESAGSAIGGPWIVPIASVVLFLAGIFCVYRRRRTESEGASGSLGRRHLGSWLQTSACGPQGSRISGEIPRPPILRTHTATFALAGLVFGYIVIASNKIAVPGFHFDELIQIVPALSALNGNHVHANVPGAGVEGTYLFLFGRSLPLMIMNYIGAVKTFAFIPIAAIFGITPESVRYFSIFLSALSLLAIFAFVQRAAGQFAALASVALLSTDPSFVFFSRVDRGSVCMMFLLKAIVLWQFIVWWKTRSSLAFFLGCFCLGLGIYEKANFTWFAGALVISACLVLNANLAFRLHRTTVMAGIFGFLAGLFPLLWFNFEWPFRTLAAQHSEFALNERPEGNFWTQLMHRTSSLDQLLDGRAVQYYWDLGAPGTFHVRVFLPLLCIAVLFFVTVSWYRRREHLGLFLVSCGALTLLAASVTPIGFRYWHVLSVYPFPHLIVGLFLARIADALGRVQPLTGFRSTSLAVAILLIPITVNLTSVGAIFKRLQNMGGSGLWSDSIYILSNVLMDGTRDAPVVILDWGISTQLVGLSGGRLHALDLYWSLNKLGTNPAEIMEPAFSIQDCRYILHSENNTQFPLARQRFFQAASASGRDLKLMNTIPTKLGEPLFEIYQVAPEQHEREAPPLSNCRDVRHPQAPDLYTERGGAILTVGER